MRLGSVFATLAILAALTAWTQPATAQAHTGGTEEYRYLIFRNGKELGTQHVSITRKDETAIAAIRIEMVYRLGFIKLYEYQHKSREEWRGKLLSSLDSSTTENGETRFVRVFRDQDTLAIDGSAGKHALKSSAFPTSYWQIGLLEHQTLFNTEDGTPVFVTAKKLEDARLMLDGQEIRAQHFRISGDLNIELWYSAEGIWLQSRFFIDDAEIIFQLQSLST